MAKILGTLIIMLSMTSCIGFGAFPVGVYDESEVYRDTAPPPRVHRPDTRRAKPLPRPSYDDYYSKPSNSSRRPSNAYGQKCLSAYGQTKCGYGCEKAYGKIKCGTHPGMQCVSAYGDIKCGYNCVKAYGKIKCGSRSSYSRKTTEGSYNDYYSKSERRSKNNSYDNYYSKDRETFTARTASKCLSAYGKIKCGYGCVEAYGKIKCGKSPGMQCMAAYGDIKCGYGCTKAYGQVKCKE